MKGLKIKSAEGKIYSDAKQNKTNKHTKTCYHQPDQDHLSST